MLRQLAGRVKQLEPTKADPAGQRDTQTPLELRSKPKTQFLQDWLIRSTEEQLAGRGVHWLRATEKKKPGPQFTSVHTPAELRMKAELTQPLQLPSELAPEQVSATQTDPISLVPEGQFVVNEVRLDAETHWPLTTC